MEVKLVVLCSKVITSINSSALVALENIVDLAAKHVFLQDLNLHALGNNGGLMFKTR